MTHRHGKAIVRIIDAHWKAYRKYLKRCRREASENDIHQFRISIRRMIALVQLITALSPAPRLRKARKTLKRQLDEFDTLRDTQVMLMSLEQDARRLPALQPVVSALKKRESALLAQSPGAIARIHSRKIAKVLKRAERYFKKSPPSMDWLQELKPWIQTTWRTAEARYLTLDANDPNTLHQLRIAVKKYRYLLAAASPLLPEAEQTHVATLKHYQDLLGDIQNSAVLIQYLEGFFDDRLPPEVGTHYRQTHAALVNAFWQQKESVLNCRLTTLDE